MNSTEKNQSSANEIKALEKESVHKICSGQVVLSLAVAIKELVENSIDAGATVIEVKLKEYGSDLIEVVDNGSGIAPSNFEALALKHYTSKLCTFEDLLTGVTSFGFRGEALSSLCALADVNVVTCLKGSESGFRLTYDHQGHLKSQVLCSRQIGTTVTVQNLFATLPVRRKEFMSNLKREFGKMLNLLTAYCLLTKGVRITCTNIVNDKKKAILTSPGSTLKENVAAVFGAKQNQSLLDLKSSNILPDIASEYGLSSSDIEHNFEIKGCVSSCGMGDGRSSSDRQYFSINGRPCDMPRFQKLINTVYKNYNRFQFPVAILDFSLPGNFVDVNLTPDKRQVLVKEETILMALFHSALVTLYEGSGQSASLGASLVPESKVREDEDSMPSQKFDGRLTEIKSKLCRPSLQGFQHPHAVTSRTPERPETRLKDSRPFKQMKLDSVVKVEKVEKTEKSNYSVEIIEMTSCSAATQEEEPMFILESTQKEDSSLEADDEPNYTSNSVLEFKVKAQKAGNRVPERRKRIVETKEPSFAQNRRRVPIQFTFDDLKSVATQPKASEAQFRKFRATMTNAEAENELSRHFHKEDFLNLRVVGQFNCGFILALLDNDLFIVDQHAADEKYQFETLQNTTTFKTQPLTVPQPLSLSASQIAILQEHTEVFSKNGFKIQVEPQGTLLMGVPMSGSACLGSSDVEELLFMLSEESSNMNTLALRPSKVRSILASRACRRAVMIGTVLDNNQMARLCRQMAELHQPWNCPHGRPTLRHLVNIAWLKSDLTFVPDVHFATKK